MLESVINVKVYLLHANQRKNPPLLEMVWVYGKMLTTKTSKRDRQPSPNCGSYSRISSGHVAYGLQVVENRLHSARVEAWAWRILDEKDACWRLSGGRMEHTVQTTVHRWREDLASGMDQNRRRKSERQERICSIGRLHKVLASLSSFDCVN